MDLVPYLSAIILISTIATIMLGVASYLAFKLRNRRRPSAPSQRPVYFKRVRLEEGERQETRG